MCDRRTDGITAYMAIECYIEAGLQRSKIVITHHTALHYLLILTACIIHVYNTLVQHGFLVYAYISTATVQMLKLHHTVR